jgi:uncharacterized delta-60 repeat protein
MNRHVPLVPLLGACLLAWPAAASAQSTQAWAARYDGPAHGADLARRMAVDAAGNVHVTGQSTGSGTFDDFATIKYGADGGVLWTARHDGPASGYDRGTALALDGDGNVLVTGFTKGVSTGEDITTLKYDAGGNLLWVRNQDGGMLGLDRSYALAVDAAGNVHVTGWSLGSGPPASFDFLTLKYDPAGTLLWTARYNGPGNNSDTPMCIAVDGSGNVFVAGHGTGVGTVYDYTVVKYDPNGNDLWVATYNGTGNSSDYVNGLVVDAAGNAYVTGASWGWPTTEDYVTIKYTANGSLAWLARWDGGTMTDDWGQAVALDAQGNVFVTGHSRGLGSGPAHDYLTLKYSQQGALLWEERWHGPPDGDEKCWSLAVDAAGNAWVTGKSPGVGTLNDCVTLQYDPAGALLQELRYDGPASGDDEGAAVVLDAAGNAYVTGASTGSGTGMDYVTIRYAPPSAWTDLGAGLAGVAGVPALSGAGALAAGSAGSLSLESAAPSAPALLFVALASAPVPFKGGTLVAFPFVLAAPLGTDAGGALLLPFTWPAGVPAATSLWFQFAVQDAVALKGVALSNALKGVTP